jgi:D-serine deaminase-like pyridoxal phosphate-dependent protein
MTASEPFSESASKSPIAIGTDRYRMLAQAIAGQPLPLALLDLDLLEANAQAMLDRAGSLPIRLGSKSIRCVEVMQRVQALSPRFQGLLCYSAREAAWLSTQGFDDLLVAYPTIDRTDIEAAAASLKAGRRIVLMVDDAEQVTALAAQARALGVKLLLCIDLDMSMSLPGLHFGVRRSPVTTPAQTVALAQAIAAHPAELKLVGLMGYEGQIAGLQDALPGKAIKNAIVRALKRRSIVQLTARRCACVAALREAGFSLEFVNGGGTGSLESTREDSSVTEVAAGSGLYSPGLFDHFAAFHHQPALCFVLQAVRRPLPDVVTCAGGGYIASGPAGVDRLPVPYLPAGMTLLPLEGAGEVQTPVTLPQSTQLAIGDPVFFRHAKAGELAERFDHFLLLRNGAIVGSAPTYRGQAQNFF